MSQQLKYILAATYEDGFVYQSSPDDVSSKDASRNAFYDIKRFLDGQEHGAMRTFSFICQEPNLDGTYARFDLDWTKVPSGSKPMYYIKNERTHAYNAATNQVGDLLMHTRIFGFGYEFIDATGHKQDYTIEAQ